MPEYDIADLALLAQTAADLADAASKLAGLPETVAHEEARTAAYTSTLQALQVAAHTVYVQLNEDA